MSNGPPQTPEQVAVSEVMSKPSGTKLGELLVPLVILIDQPPRLPVTVVVPSVPLMSPERDPQPVPEQAPLSVMVAVSPPDVIISSSVVVAYVVPSPITSRETRSVIFIRVFIQDSSFFRWPTIIVIFTEHASLGKQIAKRS